MASTMLADQETKEMVAVRPMREGGADKVIETGIRTRTEIRTTPITRIETLLDKVDDAVLAKLWRQICPLHVDQLPDRQGIIADLADFAEVLSLGPSLCPRSRQVGDQLFGKENCRGRIQLFNRLRQ